uniref:Uncharacterized protein n=1 Tax=Knipowitschia caucasica TaxID=637954 RepID=A0AAV2KDB9_KNICA
MPLHPPLNPSTYLSSRLPPSRISHLGPHAHPARPDLPPPRPTSAPLSLSVSGSSPHSRSSFAAHGLAHHTSLSSHPPSRSPPQPPLPTPTRYLHRMSPYTPPPSPQLPLPPLPAPVPQPYPSPPAPPLGQLTIKRTLAPTRSPLQGPIAITTHERSATGPLPSTHRSPQLRFDLHFPQLPDSPHLGHAFHTSRPRHFPQLLIRLPALLTSPTLSLSSAQSDTSYSQRLTIASSSSNPSSNPQAAHLLAPHPHRHTLALFLPPHPATHTDTIFPQLSLRLRYSLFPLDHQLLSSASHQRVQTTFPSRPLALNSIPHPGLSVHPLALSSLPARSLPSAKLLSSPLCLPLAHGPSPTALHRLRVASPDSHLRTREPPHPSITPRLTSLTGPHSPPSPLHMLPPFASALRLPPHHSRCSLSTLEPLRLSKTPQDRSPPSSAPYALTSSPSASTLNPASARPPLGPSRLEHFPQHHLAKKTSLTSSPLQSHHTSSQASATSPDSPLSPRSPVGSPSPIRPPPDALTHSSPHLLLRSTHPQPLAPSSNSLVVSYRISLLSLYLYTPASFSAPPLSHLTSAHPRSSSPLVNSSSRSPPPSPPSAHSLSLCAPSSSLRLHF